MVSHPPTKDRTAALKRPGVPRRPLAPSDRARIATPDPARGTTPDPARDAAPDPARDAAPNPARDAAPNPAREAASDVVAAKAETTRRRSAELRQAIGALRSSAGELGSLWHGPGASAFLATRLEWERAATEVQDRLAGMEVLLDRARSADGRA